MDDAKGTDFQISCAVGANPSLWIFGGRVVGNCVGMVNVVPED